MADGTVTTTETTLGSAKKVEFLWVSGTAAEAGTASTTTTAAFDGDIIGFATVPTVGIEPTDNYDITVTDAGGHDVLMGAGADRDTANTEYVAGTSLAVAAGSKLTFNVTNAGTSKGGTAILYIR